MKKEKYKSILQRQAVPFGLHIIEKEKTSFNKTMILNIFLNYVKITEKKKVNKNLKIIAKLN